MDRRKFAAGGAAALLGLPLRLENVASAEASGGVNLVPDAPCKAPNYWCTWGVQNYMYGQGSSDLSIETLEGESGSRLAHNALDEHVLLGRDGWALKFFPRVRRDLYLMLDDGWEAGGTSTFELDEQKFPSFHGSQTERLRALNGAIGKAGWRGAAVWCRNTPGAAKDEKLEEVSLNAGVRYWKVDIGDPDFHLTQLRNANKANLLIEHVHGEGALNGDWQKDGRFGLQPWNSRRQEILAHTDVYRTYDVSCVLSLPTTLDRLAEMLKGAQGHPEAQALINVEDEVYVAAAMGCTMGILRHPLRGLRSGQDVDLFFNGPRQLKRRMDEVTRALLWQRIAPPFPPANGTVKTSEEILTDEWTFERGDTWQIDLVGKTARQGAPAAIARNIEPPRVLAPEDKPFVVASRFPNGAVAICMQERTLLGRAWHMPECEIELNVGDAPGPYGIFGCVQKLTLLFNKPASKARLLAQDLLDTNATDITGKLTMKGRRLELTASDLRALGLQAATKGDLSSPGLVLAWR